MRRVAGTLIDRIKINKLSRRQHAGSWYWFKERRREAAFIIPIANHFFRFAGNPVVILAQREEWIEWEKGCLAMLHGDEFATVIEGGTTLGVQEFPGTSVSDHLNHGSATLEMARAAGRELSRAHRMPCSMLPGGWSHGDPHTGNFVYDSVTDRARLMDFEVRHDLQLQADRRHADDLLVFLQDTLGRLPRGEWLAWAQALVSSYNRPSVTRHLLDRLTAPRGAARLWWAVRTTYLKPKELDVRLADLKAALAAPDAFDWSTEKLPEQPKLVGDLCEPLVSPELPRSWQPSTRGWVRRR
ncbi:MAG TPA: hypothetical protein VFG14_04385 [Chthoniobacteraceae bacterium]|nr:hypothetical protein [Chthoniobacteraceae bacterium]